MSINIIQQELLKDSKILEIEADIILPRVGGYSARPYSTTLNIIEGIRATELKALWRWWVRTALSRVYGGKEDLKTLDEKVSEILGSTNKASHFSIHIEVTDKQVLEKALNWYEKLHIFLTRELEDILNKICSSIIKLCRDKIKITKLKIQLKPPITIDIHTNNVRELLKKLQRIKGIVKPVEKRNLIRVSIKSSRDFSLILSKLCNITNVTKEYNLYLYDDLVKLSGIPRIGLLFQRRGSEESDVYELNLGRERFTELKLNCLNKQYLKRISEDIIPLNSRCIRIPVKITLFENIRHNVSEDRIKFAITVFLLGLLLSGVGSIMRRAFGSIVVKNVKAFNQYGTILDECINNFKSILNSKTSDELKKNISSFIRYVIREAKEVYGELKDVDSIPEVPTLDEDKYFKLEVIEVKDEHEYLDLLEIVGRSTLKVEWKKYISLKETSHGEKLHTWILGLPRSAKDTGYSVEDEKERRPSAIHLKLLETPQGGKKFIIVYGFLSSDWPYDKLVHKSKNKIDKRILKRKVKVLDLPIQTPDKQTLSKLPREKFLPTIFEVAFKFIVEIISQKCKVKELQGVKDG